MQSQPFESDHRVVVMDESFPARKMVEKIFSKSRKRAPKDLPDLRRLRDDPSIQALYSAKLDLISDPQPLTLDHVEKLMTNSIQKASKETIPQREKGEAARVTCMAGCNRSSLACPSGLP